MHYPFLIVHSLRRGGMAERVDVTPGEIRDVALLKRQAARRREALVAAGCSTYALGRRGGAERYCGFCHAFHSEWREAP
jgi:hypothetical protein